ncbi:MAG: hypothetical protein V1784_06315 [bacterium]
MKGKRATANFNSGTSVGALLSIVIIGLAWAILTAIAMHEPMLALLPLGGIILFSVVGLLLLQKFPQKRWRILGAILFLVACADLYLVNAWWSMIPAVWAGAGTSETMRPLGVNCVLIAFVGAGALLFLQLRPERGTPGPNEPT